MEKTTEQRLQGARESVLVAISMLTGVTEFARLAWMDETLRRLNSDAERISEFARHVSRYRAAPTRESEGE